MSLEANAEMISVPNVIRSFRYWPRVFQMLWKASPLNLLTIAAISLVQGIVPAMSIQATQRLINSISTSWHEVVSGLLFFIGVSLLALLASASQDYVETVFRAKLSNSINIMVMEQAADLTLSDFENAQVQDQLKRVQNDSGYRPFQIAKQILGIASGIVSLLSVSAFLVAWNWWIAVLLMLIPVTSFLSFVRFGQQEFLTMWKRAERSRTSWYLTYLLTRDSSFKEVKLYNLGAYFVGKYKGIVEDFFREDKQLARKRVKLSIGFQFIDLFASSGTILLAFRSAYQGKIPVGNVVGIIQAITQLQTQSQNIVQQLLGLCQSNLYMEQLFAFLDIHVNSASSENASIQEKGDDEVEKRSLPSIETIEFRDVSFAYPGNDRFSLEQVSFSLDRGETLAVVGHNGSGKSTLVKLLMQLYSENGGLIRINGQSVQDYDLSAYRLRIGAVFQDFVQYEMPLRHNVGYGNIAEIDNESKIWKSLTAAGMGDFARSLPGKLDTQLGSWFEEGCQLSGGQWQRVAIARAFMRDADVYILDEPSSFLDPEAEREVFEKFHELVQDRIGIFISHRLSSVTFADKIAVMRQGRIVELGTHEELMAGGGEYARLYRLQAESYIRQELDSQRVTNIV